MTGTWSIETERLPVLAPRSAVVMKVGYHVSEAWEEIVARKFAEQESVGHCFWGYGGSTCHPTRQVQPFCQRNEPSFVGIATRSRFQSIAATSSEYSADGKHWAPLPKGVSVVGSRYALCLKNLSLSPCAFPIGRYLVGIGPMRGTALVEYMQYRCDKGCAVRGPAGSGEIRLPAIVGVVTAPYAVFVR